LREFCENGDFFIMESFGLFDLLKSLSLFKETPTAPTQEKTTTASSVQQTKKQSEPPTQDEREPEQVFKAPPQNACLDFINRHDELARRRKRK
jgi:hypothetical protein